LLSVAVTGVAVTAAAAAAAAAAAGAAEATFGASREAGASAGATIEAVLEAVVGDAATLLALAEFVNGCWQVGDNSQSGAEGCKLGFGATLAAAPTYDVRVGGDEMPATEFPDLCSWRHDSAGIYSAKNDGAEQSKMA